MATEKIKYGMLIYVFEDPKKIVFEKRVGADYYSTHDILTKNYRLNLTVSGKFIVGS